ncbi:phosphonoacetaldehyde reductase [Aneurinibacillus migulanus]|uniref:Phosphonate metabolism-associated iron-containing alcohol dehydrogenase n=1 Tax=Aneurinibacillus migulanus TaxID=47500 RepID=A0A1G8KYU3_ANEMI|nr:phosphonoacetaldehyde reductase [Aneurinibacillus migulanus]MED0892663.1 phosphonoacetaldehyde reductase [Aneurinibacillus migulanus]MED1614304.1 phosphonoacetaldehyde reductase [Aneurinibacillus migulanus]GED14536.1 alcohol dehydrogenase EutG [Aneurinibacillus migulanus]SDI48050.1 phosphonate metabolism-associated iron-containing alcohol dehydrogenase [Aneurinibacillus migulanus]
MNNFYYYNPVKVIFGIDTLYKIDELVKSRRALIVTSPGMKRRDTLEKVVSFVQNIEGIIDDIQPNPTFETLAYYYQQVNYNEVDVIIALGGGSVIDTAKALAVSVENRNFSILEQSIKSGSLHNANYKIIPFISIPTTAGSGSEVTPWATIWDEGKKEKYSLHLPDLWSEACICDPSLTLPLPQDITIITALDALSHSFESIWNKNANPISNVFAIDAAKTILCKLPCLINNLNNIELRSEIMLSSLKAGLAFSNTQTAIAHAMSYYMTLHKNLVHGIAVSFTLPDIIDTVIGTNQLVDESIFKILGSNPVEEMKTFLESIGISTRFSEHGISKEDLLRIKSAVTNVPRAKNSIVEIDKLFENFVANSL